MGQNKTKIKQDFLALLFKFEGRKSLSQIKIQIVSLRIQTSIANPAPIFGDIKLSILEWIGSSNLALCEV